MSCGGNCGCDDTAKEEVVPERVKQWREFAHRVERHLIEYTVPQYGDVGEDAITDYSVEDCVKQTEKYAKRYGTQSREGQQELDFIKMAHYSQCAWEKFDEDYVEINITFEGDREDVFKDLGHFFEDAPGAKFKITVEEV